ncbi:Nuclear pore complex nucleoporin component [Coemansia javaensis]|uniref:mRNA export factor GLE1 n=1 Tax=Coemansia javaensis TaxID=2761396 RepID=A0A9W8HML7_9FUNG|nr:Nuclear pore complex nucleoporin component [Coemansia javaensis]
MRYGLFLLGDDAQPHAPAEAAAVRGLLREAPAQRVSFAPEPPARQAKDRRGVKVLHVAKSPQAAAHRPRAQTLVAPTAAEPPPRGRARSLRPSARLSLGAPFPVSSVPPLAPPPPPLNRGASDQIHAPVERAPVQAGRKDPAAVAAEARESACQSYARSIQKEAEDVRAFLSGLGIAQPAPPKPDSVDRDIADTLAKVDQMRRDFEKRLRDEAAAKAQAEKEKAEREKAEKEKAERDRAKRAEQERLQREQEQAEREAEEAREREEAAKAAARLAVPALQANASPAALEWAEKYRGMYRELMDGLAPQVKSSAAARAACFKRRGLITRGIGQLKDSQVFIARTADSIKGILAESERDGPAVGQWMLNLVAKAIVKQAEREVSVATHAAYPLAATAVLVMQAYPGLADMLMIRLVKKCRYVVPDYLRKQPGQSVDEYIRAIGYKENDSGELETEGIYNERMAGMVALFAAIVQTPGSSGSASPLPIRLGWTWLARMLNMAPRAISPLLVQTFLSVAGTSMAAAYPRQLPKMLDLLATRWIPEIKATSPTAVAARTNLTSYMEEYQRTGRLRECAGRTIKAG